MQNLLTPTAFLAWVEKQPVDKAYNYISNGDCPIAQYLKFIAIPNFSGVGGWGNWYTLEENGKPIEHASFIDTDLISSDSKGETFGNLASRLRAAQ